MGCLPFRNQGRPCTAQESGRQYGTEGTGIYVFTIPVLASDIPRSSKEQELFHKYRQAATYLLKARESDWETVFDMQHYGIPTRLLDWTETLGVAVFFALGTTSRGCCVCPRPDSAQSSSHWHAATQACRRPELLLPLRILERRSRLLRACRSLEDPPFQNGRLFAQRGMFTIHGDDERSLEEQCPSCVRKVLLPKSARRGALEFLQFSSLNELSIFPDIVGVASHIRNLVLSERP